MHFSLSDDDNHIATSSSMFAVLSYFSELLMASRVDSLRDEFESCRFSIDQLSPIVQQRALLVKCN